MGTSLSDKTKIVIEILDDETFEFLKTRTLGEILKPVRDTDACLSVYNNGVYISVSVKKTNYKIVAYKKLNSKP